jgi:hypothetical protein
MFKEVTIIIDGVVAYFEDISREVLGKTKFDIDLPGEHKMEAYSTE